MLESAQSPQQLSLPKSRSNPKCFVVLKCKLDTVSNSLIDILSGDGGSPEFFLYWWLSNLPFPIAFDCWSIHDESDAKCFEIYWQDNKIFGKFSRAKDYACIEVGGSRDLLSLFSWKGLLLFSCRTSLWPKVISLYSSNTHTKVPACAVACIISYQTAKETMCMQCPSYAVS